MGGLKGPLPSLLPTVSVLSQCSRKGRRMRQDLAFPGRRREGHVTNEREVE